MCFVGFLVLWRMVYSTACDVFRSQSYESDRSLFKFKDFVWLCLDLPFGVF
ncbi:hypothetical protein NTGHW29_880024 [Candidatus Nitrotoga sp. HW29]|nr:hypothetical protein NTGHW29_880024 [Candidatus Nitrotoga sp. HW29]